MGGVWSCGGAQWATQPSSAIAPKAVPVPPTLPMSTAKEITRQLPKCCLPASQYLCSSLSWPTLSHMGLAAGSLLSFFAGGPNTGTSTLASAGQNTSSPQLTPATCSSSIDARAHASWLKIVSSGLLRIRCCSKAMKPPQLRALHRLPPKP